jgi:glucarate dehydratase
VKIRSITATPVNIPLRAPYRFSYGSTASLTKTIIELMTDDGVVGLGECADGNRAADVDRMVPKLIGRDVRDILPARAACVPGMAYTPWGNVVGDRRVFAGIETAMWDARGKTEGLSLAALLGGAVRSAIPLTEYFSYRLPGLDPGENSPTDIAQFCAAMIDRHGAREFEGKVGTVALAEEVQMVAEVRAAIGDRPLGLDANGTWTVPTARHALGLLLPHGVQWFEEPCESYEEMAALRQHFPVSLSSHRIDLPKAAALGCPDAIVTNLNELGGIRGALDFIAACAAMGVGFRFHSGETGVGSAAYLHLTAVSPHITGSSQTILRWYADDVIAGGPMSPQNGQLVLPEGPGLGVTLDPVAFQRCHARFLAEGPFPAGQAGVAYGSTFRKR